MGLLASEGTEVVPICHFSWGKKGLSGPDRLNQWFRADQVEHSAQVIGQYVQTHLGIHPREGLGQEVG